MYFGTDNWKQIQRVAASTLLRKPETLSDGLEAELYALLERLGVETGPADEPGGTGGDTTE